jgi:hypothetical protein
MEESFISQYREQINKYYSDSKNQERIRIGKESLNEFLTKYPFRDNPVDIDSITEENIWKKGLRTSFFYYIEFGTKNLGRIFNYGGNTYRNAQMNLELFKRLLKDTINDEISLADKIDNKNWGMIGGFGGDRLVVKKIIYCYYSDEVIPIFKTEHFEVFCSKLNLNYNKLAMMKYKKEYDALAMGQKFEVLNQCLMEYKNATEFKSWDNSLFMGLLYSLFELVKHQPSKARESIPRILNGLLYSPKSEQEVVYLFSTLHKELGFPYILTFQTQFPDVTALDDDRTQNLIEIEFNASDFIAHGHDKKGCDYIICWENDIDEEDLEEDFPKIIEIKAYFEEIDI